jgi:hypothetical protein
LLGWPLFEHWAVCFAPQKRSQHERTQDLSWLEQFALLTRSNGAMMLAKIYPTFGQLLQLPKPSVS